MDMKVGLGVSVDTNADAKIIFINFEEVPLVAGKGRTEVEFSEDCVLQWGIVGTPETKYKITLKQEQGKLDIQSQHPIELQIPKGKTRTAGTRNFRVIP
jgi:hypothetical protein